MEQLANISQFEQLQATQNSRMGLLPMSVFNGGTNAARSITYWDVNKPIGLPTAGTTVVIGGDAPVWKFCNLFHKSIAEHGAAIVATGVGVEKSINGDDYVIGYSTDEEYHVGDTIPIDLISEDDLGDLPELDDDDLE
jgi:hypothetical protein